MYPATLQKTYLRLSTILPNEPISDSIRYPVQIRTKDKTVAATGLLDCEASELFISHHMIRKHDIPLIPLKKPKKVFNADRTENKKGKVTHVICATIIMDQHEKDKTIWVTDIGEEEFIIGLTWLRRWNPNIDWITGKMIIPLQIRAKITKSQEIAQPIKDEPEEKFEDKFPSSFNQFKPLFDEKKSHRLPEA